MDKQPYESLTGLELLELCVWREAQNQGADGMHAVAWSIKNRVDQPTWWSESKLALPSTWHGVILKPWQYSAFNKNDPNSEKWPSDDDEAFETACKVCAPVYLNQETTDPTNGATHYYDTSIEFPKGWGNQSSWINTLNTGKLKFWKLA